MALRFHPSTSTTKFIIIGEFLFVAYLLFSLVSSVYKSYQYDLYIKKFEADNARIEEEHHKMLDDFEYYTSDAYQEKYAKENLNLVNHGEEKIILPSELFDHNSTSSIDQSQNQTQDNLSVGQKWWQLFFGEEE